MMCDVLLIGAGTLPTEGYEELRLEDWEKRPSPSVAIVMLTAD